jgi:hypothetical protein
MPRSRAGRRRLPCSRHRTATRTSRWSPATLGGVRSGAGSGRRLRPDARVRTRRLPPGCCRRSGYGGFGRLGAWHRGTSSRRRHRRRGGIWRSPTGSRSRSGAPRGMGCARSRSGWLGRRRRFRGSAPQRRHARRRFRVPSDDGAVACGSRRASAEAGEAGGQCHATAVRAGAVGRRGRRAKRREGPQACGAVEGAPARAAAASAVGPGVESRANRPAPPARLPRR